jgi:hypothetical protein
VLWLPVLRQSSDLLCFLDVLQLATFFKLVAITTIIAKSRLDRGRFVSVAVCCILKMIAYAVGLAPALVRMWIGNKQLWT